VWNAVGEGKKKKKTWKKKSTPTNRIKAETEKEDTCRDRSGRLEVSWGGKAREGLRSRRNDKPQNKGWTGEENAKSVMITSEWPGEGLNARYHEVIRGSLGRNKKTKPGCTRKFKKRGPARASRWGQARRRKGENSDGKKGKGGQLRIASAKGSQESLPARSEKHGHARIRGKTSKLLAA